MTTLAVLVTFAVGACFGALTICLLAASSRNEATEPRPFWRKLWLVTDATPEPPEEHLRNALMILGTFAYLNNVERWSAPGMTVMESASARISAALAQLEAEHRETA